MDTILRDMVIPGIPIIEKIIRPIIIYLFLVIAVRLAGKRELAQLSTFDLVVMLTLSNAVQNAIIGNDNSVSGGVIGATSLLVIDYLTVSFLYKHRRFDRMLQGSPTVLVDHGKILPENLRKEMITVEELMAAIRRQGLENLSEIDQAILETGGTLSIVQHEPTREETFSHDIAHRLEIIENLLRRMESGPHTTHPAPEQG